MQIGDLVWMPPSDHGGHGLISGDTGEPIVGLVLSEPTEPPHRTVRGLPGRLRVMVMWSDEGETSIDWEPADWLKPLSFV